jgi:hypothetical protein
MKILLINGYAGSGKDVVASFLTNRIRLGIADCLKNEVSSLHGINRNLLDSQNGKKILINEKYTIRDLLIKHANDKKQQYGKNYWIDKVVKIIKTEYPNKKIVLPDYRYPNEYYTLVENFGIENVKTLKIIRPGIKILEDASEHQLEDFAFDYTIYNDSCLESLKRKTYQLNLNDTFKF